MRIISLLRGRDFSFDSSFGFPSGGMGMCVDILGGIHGCKEKGACLGDKPTLRVI